MITYRNQKNIIKRLLNVISKHMLSQILKQRRVCYGDST